MQIFIGHVKCMQLDAADVPKNFQCLLMKFQDSSLFAFRSYEEIFSAGNMQVELEAVPSISDSFNAVTELVCHCVFLLPDQRWTAMLSSISVRCDAVMQDFNAFCGLVQVVNHLG